MSPHSRNGLRLDEKQVGAILRRAAELQEEGGQALSDSGTSPDDIVKIGAELGIDPACLQRAIEEVVSGDAGPKRSVWGGPVTYSAERAFVGTIGDDEWHEVVSELRSSFGAVGEVSEVAGAKEWSDTGGGLGSLHVSVRSRGGTTTVRAKSDLSGALVLGWIVAFVPGLIVGLLIHLFLPTEWWVKSLAIFGLFFLLAAGVRRWIGSLGSQRVKAAQEVFARMSEIAAPSGATLQNTLHDQEEAAPDLPQRLSR